MEFRAYCNIGAAQKRVTITVAAFGSVLQVVWQWQSRLRTNRLPHSCPEARIPVLPFFSKKDFNVQKGLAAVYYAANTVSREEKVVAVQEES